MNFHDDVHEFPLSYLNGVGALSRTHSNDSSTASSTASPWSATSSFNVHIAATGHASESPANSAFSVPSLKRNVPGPAPLDPHYLFSSSGNDSSYGSTQSGAHYLQFNKASNNNSSLSERQRVGDYVSPYAMSESTHLSHPSQQQQPPAQQRTLYRTSSADDHYVPSQLPPQPLHQQSTHRGGHRSSSSDNQERHSGRDNNDHDR